MGMGMRWFSQGLTTDISHLLIRSNKIDFQVLPCQRQTSLLLNDYEAHRVFGRELEHPERWKGTGTLWVDYSRNNNYLTDVKEFQQFRNLFSHASAYLP